jgi:phage shock protein C
MTKFYRSRVDKRLSGVCGGISEATKIDSTLIRIIFVCLFFTPIPIFMFYVLVTLLLNKKPYGDCSSIG